MSSVFSMPQWAIVDLNGAAASLYIYIYIYMSTKERLQYKAEGWCTYQCLCLSDSLMDHSWIIAMLWLID